MSTFKGLLGVTAMLALTGVADAALSITPLGTAAPPATFVPPGSAESFPLIPAMDDTTPIFADVLSAPLAPGKNVLFSSPVSHRSIGAGWASWSHGYTGDVYYSNGAYSLTMSFDQKDIQAFFFYTEPNIFGILPMSVTATADDGTFHTLAAEIQGYGGAQGFLIATDGGHKLGSITVSSEFVDFAVGEFGYAKSIPAPGPLALLGVAGIAVRRRRA